jgi:hypothetical protein
MAFTRMSAGYPYGIRTLTQGGQDELDAHPAGAGNPDYPDVGRVFHATHAGEISRAVAAPVAKKTYDFRFFV